MVTLTVIFCLFVVVLGAWTWVIAPNRKQAVIVLGILYFGLYAGWASIMGWPKPILPPSGEIQVVAYHLKEGEGIYLWVLEKEPRAYRIPWDMERAKQLRKAGQDAQEQGQGLMMDLSRGFPEGDWVFYPEPVEELPPKQ
jgi:hypothetical protein